MGRPAIKLACAALTLLALLAEAPQAQADDTKKRCAAAYEQAQVLRKERKLTKAEEQLAVCSQAACPMFVRRECAQWTKDVKTKMPTVVFEVRDAAGKPLTGARVLIDGKVLKDPIDDGEVAVDPGDHVLRYELPGADPIEQGVTFREGEKSRKLSILFDTAQTAPPPPPPPSGPSFGTPPVIVFVLGGVGVAGVAAFATLGILGKNERDDLRDTCAPSCSEDDVSSVRTKLILADVSLGVGVVSLGVATYFFITAPRQPPPPKSGAAGKPSLWFDVSPRTGGGSLTIGGRF
jgi:hypothetical protein